MFCVYSWIFCNSDMAKYYREISQLLVLGQESFEDELRQIVSITDLGNKVNLIL